MKEFGVREYHQICFGELPLVVVGGGLGGLGPFVALTVV